MKKSSCTASHHGDFLALYVTHLLDVLQRDPVLPKLLVDEDEGVEVTHPPVKHLIRKPARTCHDMLVHLQQSGRSAQETQSG